VHNPRFAQRAIRRVSVLAALGAALGIGSLSACGPDPFAVEADTPVVLTTFQIWAITGSPAPFPTAYSVQNNVTIRLEPSGAFDVAFDITPDGKLQVLPIKAVVAPIGGARTIGVQVATVPYIEVTEAPRTGWNADSTIELVQGQTFLLQVASPLCAQTGRPNLHAKMTVDTIIPAERRALLRGRVNPNCGFRSFADGIPEF
jgi:hypothetical protein